MTDTTDTTTGTTGTTTAAGAGDRRRIGMVALAAGVVLAAAAVAAWRVADRDPAGDAIALLGTESRFDSSREAVESFAEVYERLAAAAAAFPKDCDVAAGRGRCLGLNQAAGWSLSFSPASAQCTQPHVQAGRLALLDYVTKTAALGDGATEAPPPPLLPAC